MSNHIYPLDVSSLVDQFQRDGFVYLPSIKSIVQSEGIIPDIYDQLGGATYAEGIEVQRRLIRILNIDALVSALFPVLVAEGFSIDLKDEYLITRFVKPGQSSESYRSHFDGHLLTLVLPIQMPRDLKGARGELKFLPKARNQPKSEIKNVFEKILWKRYASDKGMATLEGLREVKTEFFTEGKPLLFRGTTTFHGNNFLAEGQSDRISMLCHYFDPSPALGISNILRKIRGR